MANDQELKYKITTQGDASGANVVAAAIGKVDRAAKDTGKSAGETARNLNQTGEAAEKLRGGAQVVEQVLSGNLRALSQFPAVLKGIGAAISANPLFALGTVLGLVIIPALQKLKEGWEAAGRAAAEAGKKNAATLAAARLAIAEKQDNQLALRMKEIGDGAARARKELDLLTAAAIEQNDFEEAQALAKFDEDAKKRGLSDAQATLGRAGISQKFRDNRQTLELQSIDQGVALTAQTEERKRRFLAQAQANEAAARTSLDTLRARSPDVIQREFEAAKARVSGLTVDQNFATRANLTSDQQKKIGEDLNNAREAAANLADELAAASLNYKADEEAREKVLKQASARRAEAEQAAADAIEATAEAERQAEFRRGSVITKRATEKIGEESEVRDARVADASSRPRFNQLTGERIPGTGGDGKNGTQSALNTVAVEVAAAPPPPALDVEPLRKSFLTQQGKIINVLVQNQTALDRFAKELERQGAQLQNLSASSQ